MYWQVNEAAEKPDVISEGFYVMSRVITYVRASRSF